LGILARDWILGLTVVLALFPYCTAHASDYSRLKGPLPTRNFNPVQLMFLALPAEEADVLPPGRFQLRFEVGESNVILSETRSSPSVNAVLKFETFRLAFDVKYGLTKRVEAGLEIPLYYRDKGFLDPFIISMEEAFSDLSPKRIQFSRGSFEGYEIRRNGQLLVSGDRGDSGLGDIALYAKFLGFKETSRRPALSMRGAIKLPTGSHGQFFGRSKTDLGLGLVIQKALHSSWVIYLNQNLVLPVGEFLDTGLTLNPISTTILSLEWIWSSRFSWLTQFDLYTTPFHATGINLLDRGVLELAIGFDYALRPHVLWQLFGIENFNRPYIDAAADFTLVTTITYRF
jgi:hypothetical protein